MRVAGAGHGVVAHGDCWCDSLSGRVQSDICRSGKEPTINDPELCTVNRRNVGHPTLDIYKHNPWR